MPPSLSPGLSHAVVLTVTAADTARMVGSGGLEVFATPRMIALMEQAAMLAVAPALPEGSTTVGCEVAVRHLRPSAVGAQVRVVATLDNVDERMLSFAVEAFDGELLVGIGTHVRAIVDSERFMSLLAARTK